MAQHLILPRALRGSVHAETSPADVVRKLDEAFKDFKMQHDGRLNDVEASLNEKITSLMINGSGGRSSFAPNDPEYTRTFASYFRKGDGEFDLREANAVGQRAQINAAMSVGTADSGGYLAPTE